MGGLAGRLGITFLTFMVGTLALIGLPPFSGFFSKDAILALAYQRNMSIFILALGTAFLTAFYSTRLLVIVFFGKPRSDAAKTSKESPLVMTVPLIVLAFFVVFGGGFAIDLPATGFVVPALAILALLLGGALAIAFYKGRTNERFDVDLLRRRFYIDDFYQWLISSTQDLPARVSAFIDRGLIDAGAVRGASSGTWGFGALLRLIQVGNLQAYAFLFGLGIVALIYFAVFR
jgi:NADH-quinone oxidoreductase subunit L